MTRLLAPLRLSTTPARLVSSILATLSFPSLHRQSTRNTLLVLLVTLFIALYSAGSSANGGSGGGAMAAATTKSARGLLKLCPPGGESFANAWQITCGMKRRKKREAAPASNSTTISDAPTPSTSVDKTAAEAAAGAALTNPEPLMRRPDAGDAPGKPPAEPVAASARSKRSIFDYWMQSGVEKKGQVDQMIAEEDDEGMEEYRAPSMAEMMVLCCRYGCSLRDLLPYCDPFGEWDS